MQYIGSLLKEANNNVTVAVSGGVDSMAVLYRLKKLSEAYENDWKNPCFLKVRAFHYNHNLRSQNHLMRMRVEEFCQDFKIPLIVKNREPGRDASEAECRKDRYKAMVGLGYVITAHHLDDACESYMMNCFNGTPEYLPIPLKTEYKDMDLTVIRPFIMNEKKVFQEYADSVTYGNGFFKGLSCYIIEDDSNRDEGFRRNWIRNNLLPQINAKGYNIHTIVRKMYDERIKS